MSQTYNNVLNNIVVKAIVDMQDETSTKIPSIIKPILANNIQSTAENGIANFSKL